MQATHRDKENASNATQQWGSGVGFKRERPSGKTTKPPKRQRLHARNLKSSAALQPYAEWLESGESKKTVARKQTATQLTRPVAEKSKQAAQPDCELPGKQPTTSKKASCSDPIAQPHATKKANLNTRLTRCEIKCAQIRRATNQAQSSAKMISDLLSETSKAKNKRLAPVPAVSVVLKAVNSDHWTRVSHFHRMLGSDSEDEDGNEAEVIAQEKQDTVGTRHEHNGSDSGENGPAKSEKPEGESRRQVLEECFDEV
jgi:hypothetical protein